MFLQTLVYPFSTMGAFLHFFLGPTQLWQFLLELLLSESAKPCIEWTGDGWEFKLNDPDEVARKWGLRKNKPKVCSVKFK